MIMAPRQSIISASSATNWNEALHGVARAGYATVFRRLSAGRDVGHSLGASSRCYLTEGARSITSSCANQHALRSYFLSPSIASFATRWGRGQETYGEIYLARLGWPRQGTPGQRPEVLEGSYAETLRRYSGPEPERHARPRRREICETYLPAFRTRCGGKSGSGVRL